MFNPIFIKSVVYAGLTSNVLAVMICVLFREMELLPGKFMTLGVWVTTYIIHKKFLGTW